MVVVGKPKKKRLRRKPRHRWNVYIKGIIKILDGIGPCGMDPLGTGFALL